MLGVKGSRGKVEDDRLLQNRVPVLIAAVNLHLVEALRFEPAGENAQHHGATERRRELLAPQRVDAGAENVNKPVARTLGSGGEHRPGERQLRDLPTSPPFITRWTFTGFNCTATSASRSATIQQSGWRS